MNNVDDIQALDLATREFGDRLGLVEPAQWKNTTPCTDWDVRHLVAHVVGGNRFAALVLRGQSCEEAIEAVMTVPQLGLEPAQDIVTSTIEQRLEFDVPGRLAALVHHPLGTMTAARFLSLRVVDIALHAWDLAIGINENSILSEDLVSAVRVIVEGEDAGMEFGIHPLGRVGPNASGLDKLLDLMGRQPPH